MPILSQGWFVGMLHGVCCEEPQTNATSGGVQSISLPDKTSRTRAPYATDKKPPGCILGAADLREKYYESTSPNTKKRNKSEGVESNSGVTRATDPEPREE